MTLTYVYGIQSVQLYQENIEDEIIPEIIEDLIDSGKRIFLVVEASAETEPRKIGRLKAIPFGEVRISIPRLEETQGERIRKKIGADEDPTILTLYRIVREI